MKKIYKAAEIDIILFDTTDVIVASAEDVFVPSYEQGDNETEML